MKLQLQLCSFGISRRVDWLVEANVSEKNAVSIFGPEDGDSNLLRNASFY
jgi:hypothetical protein